MSQKLKEVKIINFSMKAQIRLIAKINKNIIKQQSFVNSINNIDLYDKPIVNALKFEKLIAKINKKNLKITKQIIKLKIAKDLYGTILESVANDKRYVLICNNIKATQSHISITISLAKKYLINNKSLIDLLSEKLDLV